MPIFTCKDCHDRKLACHASCEKYKSEKAEYEKRRKERERANWEYNQYQSASVSRNMDISAKRRHGMGWRYG